MAVPIYAVVLSALATLMTLLLVLTREPSFEGRPVGTTTTPAAAVRSLFRQRRAHGGPFEAI